MCNELGNLFGNQFLGARCEMASTLTLGSFGRVLMQESKTALEMTSPTSALLHNRDLSAQRNCPVTAFRNPSTNSFSSAGSKIFPASNNSGAQPAYCEHNTGTPDRMASLATSPQTSVMVGKIRTSALR